MKWPSQGRSAGHELKNGDLLLQAEQAGYNLLLTSDKNIRYQQNLSARKIAIVALGTAKPGSYAEVEIPHQD